VILITYIGGGRHSEPIRLHAGQPSQQIGTVRQQAEVAQSTLQKKDMVPGFDHTTALFFQQSDSKQK
jgi:hypothetical protein